jgi:O-antigen/teichoic acid export membrane protein
LIVARVLGPHGRAQYALPLNLALVIWICVHLSIEASIARAVARREATFEQVAQAGTLLALVLGCVGFVLAAGLGLALRNSALAGAPIGAILAAAATVPAAMFGQLAASLLFRRGRLRGYAITQAAQGLLQLVLLGVVALTHRLRPTTTLEINLVVIVLANITLVVLLARDLGRGALVPRRNGPRLFALVRTGLVLHLASIALFLNLRIDLLLVGVMRSADAAGRYSLSTTLAELVLVGTATIGLAALRNQTELDAPRAVDYTIEFARRSLGIATLFAVIASALAYPLIVLAYGHVWSGSVLPFVILTVGAVGLAVESPVRGLLLRLGRPLAISLAAAVATIVNVALNLLLIPSLGISGAAIASACSYWLAAALMLALLQRTSGVRVGRALRFPSLSELAGTLRPRRSGAVPQERR